jgi:hypothetical protein
MVDIRLALSTHLSSLDVNPTNRVTRHPSPVPCYQGIFYIFLFLFFGVKKNKNKFPCYQGQDRQGWGALLPCYQGSHLRVGGGEVGG